MTVVCWRFCARQTSELGHVWTAAVHSIKSRLDDVELRCPLFLRSRHRTIRVDALVSGLNLLNPRGGQGPSTSRLGCHPCPAIRGCTRLVSYALSDPAPADHRDLY
jgi:hypothetical protein